MVFIDGSNLFPNLLEAKLMVPSFFQLGKRVIGSRQLTRVYLYTCAEKLDSAKSVHGNDCFSGCRVVLGDSVPLPNGGHREKGVDALLVADLVYHAAMKNYQYATVISNDSDFAVALRRVEDFGCRTGIVSIVKPATGRLIGACDDYQFVDTTALTQSGLAKCL